MPLLTEPAVRLVHLLACIEKVEQCAGTGPAHAEQPASFLNVEAAPTARSGCIRSEVRPGRAKQEWLHLASSQRHAALHRLIERRSCFFEQLFIRSLRALQPCL